MITLTNSKRLMNLVVMGMQWEPGVRAEGEVHQFKITVVLTPRRLQLAFRRGRAQRAQAGTGHYVPLLPQEMIPPPCAARPDPIDPGPAS